MAAAADHVHPHLDHPPLSPEVEALVIEVIGRVADKWTMIVLEVLIEHGELRFTRIGELANGIRQKMLTQTLRDLQRDGLVARQVFDTKPPSVEYRLTQLGQSIIVPMGYLIEWASKNHPLIDQARVEFDTAA